MLCNCVLHTFLSNYHWSLIWEIESLWSPLFTSYFLVEVRNRWSLTVELWTEILSIDTTRPAMLRSTHLELSLRWYIECCEQSGLGRQLGGVSFPPVQNVQVAILMINSAPQFGHQIPQRDGPSLQKKAVPVNSQQGTWGCLKGPCPSCHLYGPGQGALLPGVEKDC